ncbi:MAG: NUDIX hydrolase [Thermodesulfobacteriota bacterium]
MKIIGKKTLWQGRYLRTSLTTYVTQDGTRFDWECYERTSPGVVIVVPILPESRVLLIRQFRPPVGRPVLELPAGLIDPGEAPEVTARRELIEETGYAAGRLEPLIKGPYSPALTNGTLDVFAATELSFVGKTGGDGNENIETLDLALKDVMSHIERWSSTGQLVDLKIIGFIELARRRLGL